MGRLPHDGQVSPRRFIAWFALAVIVPMVTLVWLAGAVFHMDRDRNAKDRGTARDQAAELAATALQRTVAELDERVSTFSLGQASDAGSIGDDVVMATFGRQALIARAGLSLPYYPTVPQETPFHSGVLEHADALELVQGDHRAALRLLEPLMKDGSAQVRAKALLRVARLERKEGRVELALDAYARLAALDEVLVNDLPAGLLGTQGRALTLAAAGRQAELRKAAAGLLSDADRGRWPLSRPQYDFARQQAADWLPPSPGVQERDDELAALAAVAEITWEAWRVAPTAEASTRRRTTVFALGRSVLVLARETAERQTVLMAGPTFFERHWRTAIPLPAGIELALTDAEGRAVIGNPGVPLDRHAIRPASATSLPWTVHAIASDSPRPSLSRQAVVVLAGIGLLMCAVGAGGYVITRAMARELRVARLQSDFVAAVSHEFRSPLTTVRHLSELLARGRVTTEARRSEFYGLLVRESGRLQRLIESLLNFARLESGEMEYRFESVPAGSFLRGIVHEFAQGQADRCRRFVLLGDDRPLPEMRADRELLARVFLNLLDNAVKYSSATSDVRVEVDADGSDLLVRVCDRGMGIPAVEQTQVFQKFVRGAAAKAASIKGTGIGLAIAREVVRAHGGDITVESHEGVGSTFIVRLPGATNAEEPGPSRQRVPTKSATTGSV